MNSVYFLKYLFRSITSICYCFLIHFSVEGIEIRAIFDDTENIRLALLQRKAVYKGDYAFTDHIYSDSDCGNLNDGFLRIREYQRTNWQQKSVVIIHKIRDIQEGNHQTLFKEECDTLEEANWFIPMSFSKKFSFFRYGSEYYLDNMRVYVEKIDGLAPSIEVIAPSRQEILSLFESLNVTKILIDSVPEWYNKTNVHSPIKSSETVNCSLLLQ